jgi:hypothetical protein
MSATGTIEITNTYKNLKITSEFLNDEYRLVRNDGTENIEDWKWDKGEVWSCISGNDIREVQLTFLNDSKGETPSALHIDNLNPLMKSYIILYRIK